MSDISDNIIICPPIMLANKRTIKAAGLVNIPNTSIKGMIGNGNFNHNGTSGQNISFQYSFVPRTFTTINVHKARTIVTAILPVGENYDQP